jgi:AraC family transcriptional regulator of adaptative response/methylated-DNA-[protein]-cysteine methyltransferase
VTIRNPALPPVCHYGFAATLSGTVFIAAFDGCLAAVEFAEADAVSALLASTGSRFPHVSFHRDDTVATQWAKEIFPGSGSVRVKPEQLLLRGTDFQKCVWLALLEIPCGSTTTYAKLAASIGRPRAARALGRALGANRLAVVVPCHRVICENGGPGGYRWGVQKKLTLLQQEVASLPLSQLRRNSG